MRVSREEEMAIKMAKLIHCDLGDGLGMTGGTAKPNIVNLDELIRKSDQCVVSKTGLCNKYRNPEVPEIRVTECNIPFKPSLEFIKVNFPNVRLISGLAVANTFAKKMLHPGLPLEKLNTCTFSEIEHMESLPVINWVRPEVPENILEKPIEEFRILTTSRPKWILKMSKDALKSKFYTWAKNGYFVKLPAKDVEEKASNSLFPHQLGTENDLDFGMLVFTKNPFAPDKKIVLVGGNHWLGTLAISAMINLVKEMPEIGKEFKNPYRSMAWLWRLVEKEKIENFQAIFRVTESLTLNGKAEVEVYIVGVFSLG